ncbi:hypothetical protein Mucpa_6283 [Mucilaginibacter paludis DSM 18603]|uniref:Uncharacterized protein n=1 Tax=Mucilaginibacter paludis DSM 18603 TaxID=714943 RepID=H1Y3S7_9SPHI|nr:hypothetical protein Mucpa_6283 [Mucilaginibacter paludis DSM 18603]
MTNTLLIVVTLVLVVMLADRILTKFIDLFNKFR